MTEAFEDVFKGLKALLKPHTKTMDITHDEPGRFWVDTAHIMSNGKPLFFGAVEIKKKYVSYHLMPVYVTPALLNDLSPELKRRMQGKSCFNFKAVDRDLSKELGEITRRGRQSYRDAGYLKRAKS
ncbi:MAG: hypothetical protein AB8C46_20820 [Burkholderiaceae bacterium]